MAGQNSGLSSIGQEALRLAECGLRVIPLHFVLDDGRCSCGRVPCPDKPGKHPLGTAAPHGLDDATADPEQIRRWWTNWPAANAAICTGAGSGVFVVGPDGPEGIEALGALARKHGPLPRTWLASTGHGGQHVYLRWPAGGEIGNRRNHRGLAIDVR